MSPRPAKFRQVDVSRAVKAVIAAGLEISRVEIDPEGRIVIFNEVGHIPTPASTVAPGRLALERWKAEQNGKAE